MKYIEQINDYWTEHVDAFIKIYFNEFNSDIYEIWSNLLEENLPVGKKLSVLDVGCGTGFFSIVLAKLGHLVTGIDYNDNMLEAANKIVQLGSFTNRIKMVKMDAQNLEFDDESFDAVISRNLTWVLEKPELAYKEWYRVLKKGGRIINIDANWDIHLHDEKEMCKYNKLLDELTKNKVSNIYSLPKENSGFTEIRKNLPLSKEKRPFWDFKILYNLGCERITVKPKIDGKLYDDFYDILYADTPTFMVCAIK